MIIAVAAIFCSTTAAHAADSYFELNGYSFSINSENEATIHGYSGSNTNIAIPNKLLRAPVVYIDGYAFYNQEISTLDLSTAAGLISIGDCAFSSCTCLEELTIPSGVTLSFGAFQGCTGLQALTIDEGITAVPEQCFYDCSALSEITLPGSVTTIGTRAFGDCFDLRYAYLSDHVDSIAANAFENDDLLTIRCEYGSFAAQYAKDNDIDVEYLYRYINGDADGDGDVSVFDVTVIQRVEAGIIDDTDSLIALRGCVTDEDALSIVDATVIQRYLAHLSISYSVGEEAAEYTKSESAFI